MSEKRQRKRETAVEREGREREAHSEGDKEKRQERKLNALKRFEYYVCRVVATYRDSVEGRGTGGEYLRGGTGERQLSCITNAQREDVAFDQSRHFTVSVVVVACVTAVCCCSCCGHSDLF